MIVTYERHYVRIRDTMRTTGADYESENIRFVSVARTDRYAETIARREIQHSRRSLARDARPRWIKKTRKRAAVADPVTLQLPCCAN